MRRRIENRIVIDCKGVDLTKVSNLEFYVKQRDFFFQYTPEVISASQMVVVIPLNDAKTLAAQRATIQLAYTDENGNPFASEISSILVGDLLKEAGYGFN